jgi:hypothetical protein
MFTNIGYRLEAETRFEGIKNDVRIPVLISVLFKEPENAKTRERELWDDFGAPGAGSPGGPASAPERE